MGAATGTPWSLEIGMPHPIGAIAEAAMNNRRVFCILLCSLLLYADAITLKLPLKSSLFL